MYCSPIRPASNPDRSRSWAALSLLVLLALFVPACGHKAPPLPPPNMAPQTTQDIKVHQRGMEVRIDFAYPRVTVSGATLTGIEAVEIWQLAQPVPESIGEGDERPDEATTAEAEAVAELDSITPEDIDEGEDAKGEEDEEEGEEGEGDGAEGDGESLEARLRADPREFAGAARVAASFRQPELQSMIIGDRISLSMPLDTPLPETPEVHNLAVRTFSSDGRPSQLSKHVVLIPKQPPQPPSEMVGDGTADGVSLSWAAGAEELVGYRIYRREIRSDGFDRPIGKLDGAATTYVDRTALFGHNYAYSITAVAQDMPLLESDLAQIVEVRYEDTFAPAAPAGLVVLSGAEGVRLLWEEGRATDLAGYVVYRQERGTDFVRINDEPLTDNEFVDSEVSAGRSYTYMVKALDDAGNLSQPSDTVDARP